MLSPAQSSYAAPQKRCSSSRTATLIIPQEKIVVGVSLRSSLEHTRFAQTVQSTPKARFEAHIGRKLVDQPKEVVRGCTDSRAANYDAAANQDNGSCQGGSSSAPTSPYQASAGAAESMQQDGSSTTDGSGDGGQLRDDALGNSIDGSDGIAVASIVPAVVILAAIICAACIYHLRLVNKKRHISSLTEDVTEPAMTTGLRQRHRSRELEDELPPPAPGKHAIAEHEIVVQVQASSSGPASANIKIPQGAAASTPAMHDRVSIRTLMTEDSAARRSRIALNGPIHVAKPLQITVKKATDSSPFAQDDDIKSQPKPQAKAAFPLSLLTSNISTQSSATATTTSRDEATPQLHIEQSSMAGPVLDSLAWLREVVSPRSSIKDARAVSRVVWQE